MTLPAWPDDLPRPLRGEWAAQLQDPRLRRGGEAGPLGWRRRWSAAAEIVALRLDVTRSERAIFETFHRETTAQGSQPFTMPDPTTDGWALLDDQGRPVLDGADVPILLAATWTCLFGPSMPLVKVRGVRFTIDFDVAVMP